jgi:hypothetical protein
MQDETLRPRRGRRGANMETDAALTHRQRARLADLSLLLDKVLDTKTLTLQARGPRYLRHMLLVTRVSECTHVGTCLTSSGMPAYVQRAAAHSRRETRPARRAVQKELKRRGLLSQLQFVAANNYGLGYAAALRKVCRAVEALSFGADDLVARRSAQGSFADVLRALAKNADREVRNRAANLLAAAAVPLREAKERDGGACDGGARPAAAGARGPPEGGWPAAAQAPWRGGARPRTRSALPQMSSRASTWACTAPPRWRHGRRTTARRRTTDAA